MNLRFVLRDGKKVLQQGITIPVFEPSYGDFLVPYELKWFDVPLCDETTGEEIDGD